MVVVRQAGSGSHDARFLTEVCELATESASTDGGPFGALVVRGDDVVGRGTNRVARERDPTAHAEVVALRAAARALGTHDLRGTTVYASCQPCPMCLVATWWARVDRVVFAATALDAAAAGFDDAAFHDAVAERTAHPVPHHHVPVANALAPFAAWTANPQRVEY